MLNKYYIIAAAGGNETAIQVLEKRMNRDFYEKVGSELMANTEHLGVEQMGFLIPSEMHFEMSGGEFCGNAARAVAILFAQHLNEPEFIFTMSGFDGQVRAKVSFKNEIQAEVECFFKDMNTSVQIFDTEKYGILKIVDLGGIVHVIVDQPFPKEKEEYTNIHNEIRALLGLNERSAVGVDWIEQTDSGIVMHPVVWVKSIDSFFYETACGSGSISVAAISGERQIIQPSGESIFVDISEDGVLLKSEMEVKKSWEEISIVQLTRDNLDKYLQGFIDVYKEAFGGAPYFESYTDEQVIQDVVNPHLDQGVIFLALSGDEVVSLSAAIPSFYEKKMYNFLNKPEFKESIYFDLDNILYMSELATKLFYRGLGFGKKLILSRLDFARENGYDGVIMRTAKEGSNSKNLYLSLGGKILDGIVQNVSDNPDEVESASHQRIYIYLPVR